MVEPTLAQQRAAIRAGVSNSRVARGGDERRAIGKRIEAERRGESVVEDLNRLITPARQRRTLRTVQPVGAVPVTRGRGNYTPPPATSPGGGIAGPLTEQSYALREFHDSQYLFTADGVFVWEFGPPKKLVLTDANGATIPIDLASPE
ncbi:hypothetical protein [Pseudomonas sp.]|uniref:hypothetical protein n=1 Tax=Pseudomonas sp. TaxID=306 RepID=UPI002736320C|nr:hypothetical protein [Pseudomonas sp.]MDP2746205.1 hypothetical protein [Pseudomonas sp.]